MTRALPLAMLAAAAAAGCDSTPDPYHVALVGNLAPITWDSGRPTTGPLASPITGPIEVLDTGQAVPSLYDDDHVVAAYHVQLPDGAMPWVRIFASGSCDAPGDDPQIFADLGMIRRVGGETHFFTRNVSVEGQLMDVDTQIAATNLVVRSSVAEDTVVGRLAVVLAPGDESAPGVPPGGAGNGSGNERYPPGGPWLSCGVFVVP